MMIISELLQNEQLWTVFEIGMAIILVLTVIDYLASMKSPEELEYERLLKLAKNPADRAIVTIRYIKSLDKSA